MSRGTECTEEPKAQSSISSDAWTILADQAYEANTLEPLAYRLGHCERTIVEREEELAALQSGSIAIKHPIRRANQVRAEIDEMKRAIGSITNRLIQPRPDVSEQLAVERADRAKFEGELAALNASIAGRNPTLVERHAIHEAEYRLFHANQNITTLATHPHVVPYHPRPSDPTTMQELVLAHVESVSVDLVTRGTNNRGNPRVQLRSPYARYGQVSKLTAAEAREFGQGLLEGADQLAAAPPTPAENSCGPQETTLASASGAYAKLIEKGETGRAKRRISLSLKGCRYPISLTAEQARTIGNGLVEGAELFAGNV